MDSYLASQLLSSSKPQNYIEQLFAPYQNLLTDSNSILTLDFNQKKKLFDTTDYVWVIFSNNVLGYLSLPNQVGSKCNNGPPANMFINKKSNCIQTTSSIINQCQTPNLKTPLAISYFIGKFAIIQVRNHNLSLFLVFYHSITKFFLR